MIRNVIRKLFGTATEHEASKKADPNDLIALSRVSLAVETNMNYEPCEVGGLAFSDIDDQEFEKALNEVKGVIKSNDDTEDADLDMKDIHGTQWIVVNDESIESLAANLQFGASAMESVEYSSRLLAAVLPFKNDENDYIYVIYSFRRGSFYPFAPQGLDERDSKIERRLSTIIEDEIDVEDDRSYWYPLWPREEGLHPWE